MTYLRILAGVFAGFLWLSSPQAMALEPPKIEPLTLVSDTTTVMFQAQIADTPELRERGLMFRQVMPADSAMLFDFVEPRPVAMWMKNTLVSLDMVFVREDGTIAALALNTVPQSLDTISVQEPVRGVIELAAGTVKKLGLKKNDKVFQRIFKTQDQ
jgi:uncharacterized membrane protein (UPF0127 family)